MPPNIRPATTADRPRLAAWLAHQSTPPVVDGPCLLAEASDRILGLLSYRIIAADAAPTNLLDWMRRHRPCVLAQGRAWAQIPRHVDLQRLLTEPDSTETAAALLDHLSFRLATESVSQLRVTIDESDSALRVRYQELGFTPSLWLLQCPLPVLPAATDAEPRIRPAERHDLTALTALLVDFITGEERRADFFRLRPDTDWRRLAAAKRRCRDRILLVAEHEGQPSGFIDVSLTPSTLGYLLSVARWGWNRLRGHRAAPPAWRHKASIEGIYTAPDRRRQGIAAALLRDAASRAHRQGATELQAPIWAANHASQAFFRRQGLIPVRLALRKRLEGGSAGAASFGAPRT